jgi:4-hydroxy-2-oxoheptanedioate aldolase
MKQNPVKRKLAAGQPTFGTWLSLGSPFAARFLARVGFDWLTVDLEHSPTDWESAGLMFGAIADAGCVALARVPRGDHDHIKRVLDAGAMGIVAPMVNTVEEARAIVAATKYPPIGNRSVGGSLHALNYAASAGDYYARANDEIVVVLQTESPLGVDNAEAIYALPGVDAIFVGPNDLAANMRKPDGSEAPKDEFEAMLQRILAAGRKMHTPVGLHTQSPDEALRRAAEGWQFLAIGSELRMMLSTAQGIVAKLQPQKPAGDVARY